MRNFLLGTCFGLFIGGIVATYGWSIAQTSQPWNPYAPGSFNSSTNLYNSQLDANTDNYLHGLKLQELQSRPPCPY